MPCLNRFPRHNSSHTCKFPHTIIHLPPTKPSPQPTQTPSTTPTPPRRTLPTLFTLITLPALILALFTLGYNISTSSNPSSTATSAPALNYASCYYSSPYASSIPTPPKSPSTPTPPNPPTPSTPTPDPAFGATPFSEGIQDSSPPTQPAIVDGSDTQTTVLESAFPGICNESRIAQALLLILVLLEMCGMALVGWGWWSYIGGRRASETKESKESKAEARRTRRREREREEKDVVIRLSELV
jgi:hypothetical protein